MFSIFISLWVYPFSWMYARPRKISRACLNIDCWAAFLRGLSAGRDPGTLFSLCESSIIEKKSDVVVCSFASFVLLSNCWYSLTFPLAFYLNSVLTGCWCSLTKLDLLFAFRAIPFITQGLSKWSLCVWRYQVAVRVIFGHHKRWIMIIKQTVTIVIRLQVVCTQFHNHDPFDGFFPLHVSCTVIPHHVRVS